MIVSVYAHRIEASIFLGHELMENRIHTRGGGTPSLGSFIFAIKIDQDIPKRSSVVLLRMWSSTSSYVVVAGQCVSRGVF